MKIKIFITFFIVSFLKMHKVYSNSEETKLSPVRNLEMKADDLKELVGMPFASQENQSFHIHNTNSNGETVGIASFKNSNPNIGNSEIIAWYWNPQSGFQIISSRSELLNAYEKDTFKTPFQFYKLMINESGTVAGSFLVDQPCNYLNCKFNQYAWLCWSEAEDLHLSELPSECQILKGLNDHGFALLEHNRSIDFRNFKLILKNTDNPNYTQIFDFSPISEFPPTFEEELKKLFCEVNNLCYASEGITTSLNVYWYPFCANSFDNDLRIVGQGACKASFYRRTRRVEWTIQIGYEVDNGKVLFYVKEIKNTTDHKGPNLRFPEMQYLIYEKEISPISRP